MDLTRALDLQPSSARRRADKDTHRLIGTRCTHCTVPSWPGRAVCHQCGSADLDTEAFSRSGELITYTTVHVPLPGIDVPYSLGQIQLDDRGPLVFGQVRGLSGNASVPLPVRTVVAGRDSVPWYWFELI